jgi:tripartite-type tricarboxylate transporter receptor subunit TctC
LKREETMKKLSRRLVLSATLAAFAAVAAPSLPAFAQDADKPFAGKTFRLIVPHAPGRGLDSYARMIAPYIVKHSGAAGINVENMVGAGSVIGNNAMWESKPDGLTMSFTAMPSVVLADLSGNEGVQYKIDKITYLGRSSRQPRLFLVGKNSEIKNAVDLKNLGRPFIYPVQGTDEDFYVINAFGDAIGMKLALVTGYESISDANLSVFNGDTDGILLAPSTAAAIIEQGDLTPLMTMTRERLPAYPDIPTAAEVAGADHTALNAMIDVLSLDRGFLAPPGMDEATKAALRKLMDDVHTDPELVAQAEKIRLPIMYENGAAVEAKIDAISAASDVVIPALETARKRLE